VSKPTSHREIEFKFTVPATVSFDLTELLDSSEDQANQLAPRHMVATYFDTPTLSLLRWGVTLRHRTGGGDDGWHMKLPVGEASDGTQRDEIHADGTPSAIPGQLATIAAPLIRRQELRPMATVTTNRTPFVIADEDGQHRVEIVDDLVTVTADSDSGSAPTRAAFHEVEVELLIDSKPARQVAADVSRALIAKGAQPSSVSKAARALGPAAADPPDVPSLAFPKPSAPSVDALKAIFSTYVRDLLLADVGVRRDTPDSVHQMRVACRRLRSALKTFRPLLDTEAVAYLREELRWLASELGEVRDAEVQRSRLSAMTTNDQLRTFIIETLEERLRAASSGAMAALRSDRHDFLLEDLILLVSEPPVTADAFDPAQERLAECARAPWRRLRKAVSRASLEGPAEEWHEVRIRAKQARYAAEAVAPILGNDFLQLAKPLAKATDLLGARQDAHVATIVLREIAAQAPGDIAFDLGVLAAQGEVAGDQDIRAFRRRWPDIVHRAGRAGLD